MRSQAAPDRGPARPSWIPAAVVFGVALLLQLLWCADYALHSPYYAGMICDSRVYDAWATRILSGDWIGREVFHQAPLYPYFIAVLWWFCGRHYLVIYLAQALMTALTVLLVFRIGRARFSPAAGWAAALACALYGTLNFYAMKVLPDTLGVFLHVWLAYLLLDARCLRQWVLAGAVCGLLIIARPHALLLVPLVPAWILWGRPAPAGLAAAEARRVLLKQCAGFLVPVALLVGGVALRNYSIEPDWVPVSCNGGENFYQGNNPKAEGIYCRPEGVSPDIEHQKDDVKSVAEAALGRPLTRAGVSRYWFSKGLAFVRGDLGRYLRLEGVKLKRMFSGTEYTNMYFLWFERAAFTSSLWVFGVHFYLVLPLALLGAVLLAGEWRRLGVLYLMILLTMASMLIFYVDERYRLPMIPFLILLGAGGAERALGIVRRGACSPWRLAGLAALTLGALALTVWMCRTEPARLDVTAQQYYNLGEVYYLQRDCRKAVDLFYKSSQLAPNNWDAEIGVGKSVFALGQKETGARLYREAFSHLDPDLQRECLRDRDLDALRAYGGTGP